MSVTITRDRVVRCLRRAVNVHDDAALLDGTLLEHHVQHRDDAAFEAMVKRHEPVKLLHLGGMP